MTDITTDVCCNELKRRTLISSGIALSATSGFVIPITLGNTHMQLAHAATRTAPKTLVVLSMRGACDSLSLLVPYSDQAYYDARRVTAIPQASLIWKNPLVGFHPKMAPLEPLWTAGKMAAVQGVGLPVANRSHFAAMEEVEDADPGSKERVGWLNRLLGRDTYDNPLQGIHVGSGNVPTAIYGPAPHMHITDVDRVNVAGDDKWDSVKGRTKSLHTLWDNNTTPLAAGARSALQAVQDWKPVTQTTTKTVFPKSQFGEAMKIASRSIKGNVGIEVITIDHGFWDLHVGAGTLEWGQTRNLIDEWAKGIAAFFEDLGLKAEDVTVLTISEFGRRVKENASYGTDHGHGFVSFLFGAGVKGGIYGKHPVIENSVNADVPVTTDYRDVLWEVVSKTFPDASLPTVFPKHIHTPIGAMK